jgi:hypothetical protein
MWVIWVGRKWKYFFREDWTDSINLIAFDKLGWARTANEPGRSPVRNVSGGKPWRMVSPSFISRDAHYFALVGGRASSSTSALPRSLEVVPVSHRGADKPWVVCGFQIEIWRGMEEATSHR